MVNFARGRECFVSLSILLVSDSKVSRGAAPAAVGEPPARPGGKLPGAGGPARQPDHPRFPLPFHPGARRPLALDALSLNPAFDTWKEVGEGAGGLPLAWSYMAAIFHEV